MKRTSQFDVLAQAAEAKEVPKEKSKEEVKREWMAKVQEKGDTLRSAPKELQNDKEVRATEGAFGTKERALTPPLLVYAQVVVGDK